MARTPPDPAQAAQRWANNLAASGPKIQAGVQSVTTSPGVLAAAQAQTWLANVTASLPRWQQKMQNMSLQYWQNRMVTKGLANIATGAQNGKSKVQNFLSQFLPFVAQTVSSLPPRGGLQQNITRMTQFVNEMAASKGKFKQSQ